MFSLESCRYFVSLFLKHYKTSKCLLGAPQATVPVLIMESKSGIGTRSEAVANYVVIMRRHTHLMTGLAQGRDGVSARVFWMSALPAQSGQQAEGCFFYYFFVFVTQEWCLGFEGRCRNKAQWTKTPLWNVTEKPAKTAKVLPWELKVWRDKELNWASVTFSGYITLEAVKKVMPGDGWDLAESWLRKRFH